MNDTATKTPKSEMPVVTINQGRSRSPYFCIIQPVPGIEFTAGQPVRCVNPKSKYVTTGIVTEHYWIIDWNEMPVWAEVQLMVHYGVEPGILRTALLASDPGFKDDWARLILIRETI
ncbi:MAG TPA: hypothetical protein VFC67_17410 [Prolixibacteraceae bacterium]|nr:hypothetical protein [Prolixibacteraceae bacterium]